MPHGLKVRYAERGFSVDLRGLPRSGSLRSGTGLVLIGWLAVVGALFAVAPSMGIGLWVFGLALAVVASALVWAVLRALNIGPKTQLELGVDKVKFTTIKGECWTLHLDRLKGAEPIPLGLALRLKVGPAHHVAMVGAQPEARRWLADQIDEAILRYGSDKDVPEDLARLGRVGHWPQKV